MRIYRIIFLTLFGFQCLFAQSNDYVFFQWDCSQSLFFEGEEFDGSSRYQTQITLPFCNNVDITLKNEIFVPLTTCEQSYLKQLQLSEFPLLEIQQGIEQKRRKLFISIFPLKKINGEWQKLLFAELNIDKQQSQTLKRGGSLSSVLSQGSWYKIAVNQNGVHEITLSDLQSLGIDVSSVDPNKIQLFGRPGGMLSLLNSVGRVDDLEELAIKVEGSSDGNFNDQDKILFFGQSPHQWGYDSATTLFKHQIHYFSDYTYYFLRVNEELGLRVQNASSTSVIADVTVNSFNDYAFRESEEVNLIKSGRKWYGDAFGFTSSREFTFSFPNADAPIYLKSVFATAVPSPYNSVYTLSLNGASQNVNASGVVGDYTFAEISTGEHQFAPASSANLSIQFTSSYAGAEGWIDYLELNTRRQLKFTGSQLLFRDVESVTDGLIAEFQLSNANGGISVWSLENPLKPVQMLASLSGGVLKFKNDCSSLTEYIAFDGGYKSVTTFGSVANQDLHGLQNVDMLIVTAPQFISEAERLAQFHRDNDALSVEVVIPQKIYNEFSAGSQDVSAIRDFVKYLYEDEDNPLQYLLLFGDASYDPKDRISNNTNYIVSYQSSNSHSETSSYVSDDFFAILDDEESISSNTPLLPFLDIGVGRFPVKSLDEAKVAVDKVLSYHEEASMGAWRLNVCFVGDDNDVIETIHTAQAEQLADDVSVTYPLLNLDKIYLDAYQQESTPGGQRCEQVNQAINERIEKGAFLVNYTGHGGELGWAHERILGLDDISTWTNKNKLPLFMTATCEFSRYDDPSRNSAGEEVFLKKDAGAVALFSTSRIVFTGGNMDLNEAFLAQLFEKNPDGTRPRVGDLLRKTKNTVDNITSTNHRNFTLLGDPALCLAYPKYEIELTNVQDSIKALGEVTMIGRVVDENGYLLSGFNGYVYPSVFDKSVDYQTLGQDASPVFDFDLQDALLFRGKATVLNGEFSFSFVVPKDINYSFGNGKISLYASGDLNGELVDAAGYNEDFVVGGTAEDYAIDVEGPQLDLFMNDTLFQFGGLTNENPNLLALVFDENGVNTVGNGIGHDAIAILDENGANPIVLNDFYQSNVDNYQRGQIWYPFAKLEEGLHTLRVKLWDVYNNSSDAYTEFVVSRSGFLSIENLVNHPNPMVNFTAFYFEHNQSEMSLDIRLEIMDLEGRILEVLIDCVTPNGYRYGPIQWDGKNKEGVDLSSGVYVYRVVATSESGERLEKSGKLVISR